MAESTTTPSTDEAPVVTVETFDVEQAFGDESRIYDHDAFRAHLLELQQVATKGVAAERSALNARGKLASARMNLRSDIMRPDGFPDWDGNTDAYSLAVQVAELPILDKLGRAGKRSFDAGVRKQIERNYRLPSVVGWVLTHEVNFDEERVAFFGGEMTDEKGAKIEVKADPDVVLRAPSRKLIMRVRAHYRACKLSLPAGPFAETAAPAPVHPEGGPSGDGSGDVGPSVLETVTKSLANVSRIVPRYGIAAMLATASATSLAHIEQAGGEVENRPQVIDQWHRLATIATLTAKALEGKQEEEDGKLLAASYFNAKKDTPKA